MTTVASIITAAKAGKLPEHLTELSPTHAARALDEALVIVRETAGESSPILLALQEARRALQSAVPTEGLYRVQKPPPSSRNRYGRVYVSVGSLGDPDTVRIRFEADQIIIRRA